jgi:hypothetical protein
LVAAAFLTRSQTKNVSARSLVQASGASLAPCGGARFPTLAAFAENCTQDDENRGTLVE